MIRLCVVDLSFIVTHAHQKMKALFTALILIMEQILHKIFAFLSISFLLGIKKKKNTHWTQSCFKIYFNVCLTIVIHFMNFMKFDFIFKFPLLQHKKMYTLKLIAASNFSLLHHICFQSFLLSLRRISIQQMSKAKLTQFGGKWFFSIFIWGEQNVLFT